MSADTMLDSRRLIGRDTHRAACQWRQTARRTVTNCSELASIISKPLLCIPLPKDQHLVHGTTDQVVSHSAKPPTKNHYPPAN